MIPTFRFARLALSLTLSGLVMLACSSDEKAATPTTPKTLCTPNQTIFCRCGPDTGKAAGQEGYQTCARNGNGFERSPSSRRRPFLSAP